MTHRLPSPCTQNFSARSSLTKHARLHAKILELPTSSSDSLSSASDSNDMSDSNLDLAVDMESVMEPELEFHSQITQSPQHTSQHMVLGHMPAAALLMTPTTSA